MVQVQQKQQNTPLVKGTATAAHVEGSNTVSTATVPVGQGADVGVNEDTVKFQTNNSAQTTLRSLGEVDKCLEDISKQTGLNKKELLDIIQNMTGKSYEDLQKLKQAEYNKLTKGLKLILKSCIVNGEVDSAKLEQAVKDYSIATKTGWSLEGFYNQQQNVKKSNLVDRLVATRCLTSAIDPNDPEYEAKMEVAIEKFFEKTLLSKINKNTPQEEREKIYKAQLQTYGRLLINTSDNRDKELLGSAIDKLYRSNIVPAAQAGIEAMATTEAKANFAKHIDLKEAVTTASAYEEDVYMTEKQAQQLAHIKYSNMNANDIEADMPVMKTEAIEFFEKNKEILAVIDQKIKNHENLTEKEEAIQRERKNLHTARYAGATTGIANSENPTVIEEREDLLSTLTTDIYEIGEKSDNNFYQEVLTEVANFVEEHPETMTLSKTEFEQLMDKVTENLSDIKYSDIAKEVSAQTNTTEASSTPSVVETKGTLGVPQKEAPADLNVAAQLADLYSTQAKEEEEKTAVVKTDSPAKATIPDLMTAVEYGGVDAFYTMVSKNGIVDIISEALNNIDSIDIINAAKNLYKTYTDRQDDILAQLSMKGIDLVSKITAKSTWGEVQYETFGSFGATKLIRGNAKDALEKYA